MKASFSLSWPLAVLFLMRWNPVQGDGTATAGIDVTSRTIVVPPLDEEETPPTTTEEGQQQQQQQQQEFSGCDGTCFRLDPTLPMQAYMNPDLIENQEMMDEIQYRLQERHLVVIENAFLPEFAEAMWETFENATAKNLWTLHTHAHDDGFHYHHHNLYEQEEWDPLFLQAKDMFYHEDTKHFMNQMTGRDTFASPDCSPSYYMPGDFSLPHEDHYGQRTVAFVWHLSKDWRPEYGGGLVWLPERRGTKIAHASFNTLYLFDVHSKSDHFVSAVVHDCPSRRYTFNGWWGSTWEPSGYEDPEIDVVMASPEERADLTATQSDSIMQIIQDAKEEHEGTERYERLAELWEQFEYEHRPHEHHNIAFF